MTIEHEQIHNLVSKVLGQFTVIGIGQERTAFRHALAEEIAAHDANVRAEALREAADDYRQQALPVNSELSMPGGAGPFVDKGIEGYMEAQHDAWEWLRARADEEENR